MAWHVCPAVIKHFPVKDPHVSMYLAADPHLKILYFALIKIWVVEMFQDLTKIDN